MKAYALILVLGVVAGQSRAAPLVPRLDQVTNAVFDGAPEPPTVQLVQPVAWERTFGPGAMRPQRPPELQQEQLGRLIQRIIDIDRAVGATLTFGRTSGRLDDPRINRLVMGIFEMGVHSAYAIPTRSDGTNRASWDSLLQRLGEVADSEYRRTRNWDAAVDRMMAEGCKALGDPHCRYYTPEQYSQHLQQMRSQRSLLGVEFRATTQGAEVVSIVPDSGAANASPRLEPGDILTFVATSRGEIPLAGQGLEAIAGILRDGSSSGAVTVRFLRRGRPMTTSINRSDVRVANWLARMIEGTRIAYLYLASFSDELDPGDENPTDMQLPPATLDFSRPHNLPVARAIIARLSQLHAQGAQAVVIDLRQNPGGMVDMATLLTSEFLRRGQSIVRFFHQDMLEQEFVAKEDGKFLRMRVAILVDGRSASASEILACALQAHDRAFLVGSRTYGKDTQQIVLPQVPDNQRAMVVTENRSVCPNDRPVGPLTPNFPMADSNIAPILSALDVEMRTGTKVFPPPPDPVLQKAVAELSR
ncbi:MAG: hypothetical protein HY078_05525 [Elusimicrobia bacterium]|nr:hypothetical protein [Elusimicrobiota bacterium]